MIGLLVHWFLLGGVAFEEFGLRVLSRWWFVLQLQGIDHCSGIFFLLLLIVFWMCVSVMFLRYCVVVEAGCNWYLRDINIFSLSKNVLPAHRVKIHLI